MAMRERLPIWLQGLLLVAVSTVLLGTYWWICKTAQALGGAMPAFSDDVISYTALSVVYLGFRFLYRVVRRKHLKTISAAVFFCLGLALTAVAIYMFVLFYFFPVQRVRDASGLWSSALGSGRQERIG